MHALRGHSACSKAAVKRQAIRHTERESARERERESERERARECVCVCVCALLRVHFTALLL